MSAVPSHAGLSPSRAVLDNGVVVIAKRSPVTPAVTIHASFHAGTVYDPADSAGLSHFVSRVIDRGTVMRNGDQIAEELDGRGVSLSITVNRHALAIVCTCLVEDLDVILALIADIAIRPSFPQDEVNTRRGEIVTLIRQDEDNPSAVANEGLMAKLYGAAHPYGRRPRGTVESVERIDAAALRAFHAGWFRPSALSLALVGDVEEPRAMASAARAFGDWRAPAAAVVTLPDPVPAAARQVDVIPMMNKSQVDIAYGFTSIRRSDPAYYHYWLMNNILGQYSMGGRLGSSIRERQGMAYYIQSALDANVIPGPLLIRAGVNASNVERAVASMDEELRLMAAGGPEQQELNESRQYLIGSMPRNLETNHGIAIFLQTVEFFGLGLDFDVRLPGLLAGVTLEDVQAAARHVLDPSTATVVVAGPYDGHLL
jgi:zinc protease